MAMAARPRAAELPTFAILRGLAKLPEIVCRKVSKGQSRDSSQLMGYSEVPVKAITRIHLNGNRQLNDYLPVGDSDNFLFFDKPGFAAR
jgi:hypothetical protein